MASIPAGMKPDTFKYVLAFTVAHEGDTPFMYNNWPIKNPNSDVTVGVGIALNNENEAAAMDIRSMFKVKSTGQPASDQDMRVEFRRVDKLARTSSNLFSDYQDKSLLVMDREAMLSKLSDKMLGFWDSRGRAFPDFAAIPAQAQVVLMSWNYGARLANARHMCDAVLAGNYDEAARQTLVPLWDGQKNAAHKTLMTNAGTILREGLSLDLLPSPLGPFKPPPSVPAGAGGPRAHLAELSGRWYVTIGDWSGYFYFDGSGGVAWEDDSAQRHNGQWTVKDKVLEWKFRDKGDIRTFTVPLPLSTTDVDGTILPAGQGWFKMKKHGHYSNPIR